MPYVVFEIPSNALFKHFRPHIWCTCPLVNVQLSHILALMLCLVSLCTFCFGLVTILQGFTQNLSGLIATRFFLGFAETGILPGALYLIAMWYRREEVQKRYTLFFSSTTLAGGFGGLLASAIGKMDGLMGYKGWRWIFILGTPRRVRRFMMRERLAQPFSEGLLTVVVSFVLYFAISDFPEEAKWLSDDEKAFVKARLYEDVGHSKNDDPLTFQSALHVLRDCELVDTHAHQHN